MNKELCCPNVTVNVNVDCGRCHCCCEAKPSPPKPEDPSIEKPSERIIMGAEIDLNNSDPATCITYTDDAIGMTPGSSEWDEFFGHRPCLFKDGKVVGYLNPNDYTKFEDGSPADIVSGNAGDVMIEFPRRGLTIDTVGDLIQIKIIKSPNDEKFKYLAHEKGGENKDFFFIGGYKGFVLDGKLRSLSEKTPTGNISLSEFRVLAQNNGLGYEEVGFYQLVFRQAMFILKYRNLNSQAIIGMGAVSGGTQLTGNANSKGLDFGEATGINSVKLFGIEDFWGNKYEWVDGFLLDSERNILTSTDNFNGTGDGYVNLGKVGDSNLSGYVSKPHGNTEAGFIVKETEGSASTYFCDTSYAYANCAPAYGGRVSNRDLAGIFFISLDNGGGPEFRNPDWGARLMYL